MADPFFHGVFTGIRLYGKSRFISENNTGCKSGKLSEKSNKPVASNGRIPLSKLLADLGLEDLLPCYKQYLRSEYGCTTDRITVEQYEEQKAMLENCKNEPLSLRNFMRTLHGYK